MRNILVTAISGDIGNGILKILRPTECRLFGSDINEIAVGMDNVDKFWMCKPAADKDYISQMLAFCKENNISHVIPVNEREIEVIGQARSRFEQEGVKLVIQSPKVLDICLDKQKTAQFISNIGLCAPRTITGTTEICTDRKYIIKPCKSNGSKGIRVCMGAEIEGEIISDSSVIQEYIEGDEYTLGIFRNDEVINSIAFKRELKNGYSSLVELVKDKDISDIAEKVAMSLNLEGYINVQMRKKDGKYYIFEINPRISGTVRFRDMLGFEDVNWWLNSLDGMPVPKYDCKYEKAVGIRELNEKYLVLE